jgi:hypothetical protein
MRVVTEQTTRDGLHIVRSWGCDCWYCHPGAHPKPAEAVAREEAARVARPPMPDEVKEILRERARSKPPKSGKHRGPDPGEDAKLARYGPLVRVTKIIDHTGGGCPRVLLACGHNKTVHHDRVREARCVRCKPERREG